MNKLNITKIVSLCYFVFIFISCSSDEDIIKEPPIVVEQEELYFTLNTNDFEDIERENWIIIHNSEGLLLDYRSFGRSQILEFKELRQIVKNKITITFLYYGESGNNRHHRIRTYTDIDHGAIWRLFPEDQYQDVGIGKFKLSVNHPPSIKQVSCGHLNYIFNRPVTNKFSSAINDIKLFELNNYVVSILDNNDGWKYKFIENVQNEEDVFLNYNEFQDFDKHLEIALPQNVNGSVYYIVKSREESLNMNGYYLMNGNSLNNDYYPEILKLGYLNKFDKYTTYFSFHADKYSYTFRQDGDIPNEINIPGVPSFSLKTENVYNFELETDIDYKYKIDYWGCWNITENNVYSFSNWNVHSVKNSTSIIGDIPEEIIQKYPNINLNNLSFSWTELMLSDNYPDYIKKEFISGDDELNDQVMEIITLY